mmetsp:Transcript_24356/g.57253  ORF Transcript_24356/g.57253 Transcript_24356/m.57253 type:complete len:215 (-) Transcript_24356:13-657(-)
MQWAGHADQASRKVHVVVQPVTDLNAGRRITVSKQQCEDVVQALVLRSGVDRQVWWVGTSVRVARRLLVGVRRGESINQNARASEHLSLVIGTINDVVGRCNLLHALLRQNKVDQVAEVKLLHRVARGADLPVDFIAATDGWNLVGMEDRLDPERIARRMRRILVIAAARVSHGHSQGRCGSGGRARGADQASPSHVSTSLRRFGVQTHRSPGS